MSRVLLGHTIISDNISNNKDYDVFSLSGHIMSQQMKHLKSNSKLCRVITFMVGINNCGRDAHINTILDDYQTLLGVAKYRAHMFVDSVPE